jgi:hypothetical protein
MPDIDWSFLPYPETVNKQDDEEKRVLDGLTDSGAASLSEVFRQISESNLKPIDASNVFNMSLKTGVSPDTIMQNKEAVSGAFMKPTEEYLGWMAENRPVTTRHITNQGRLGATAISDLLPELVRNESYWKQTADGWRTGVLNVKTGEFGVDRMFYALQTNQRPTMHEEELSAINEELAQIGNVGGLLPDFAKQLPQYGLMLEKAGTMGMIGAIGGGLIGAAGGLATPVPGDEPFAIVTGAKAGAALFAKVGSAEAAFILEAGGAFEEYINLKDKEGNYISPRLAASAAIVVGARLTT